MPVSEAHPAHLSKHTCLPVCLARALRDDTAFRLTYYYGRIGAINNDQVSVGVGVDGWVHVCCWSWWGGARDEGADEVNKKWLIDDRDHQHVWCAH